MKEYTVGKREVFVQYVQVLAENEADALNKVENGGGEYLDNQIEYSHDLPVNTWDIKESD